MLGPRDHVLIAVSGGVDSMVLLHVLLELQNGLDLRLAVAHLNHQIRDRAQADADFVEQQADALGVSFHPGSINVPKLAQTEKLSLEAAARRARYEFLETLADALGCQKVALGHHLNDQVETLLLNLIRGAGPPGLAAMPAKRGPFVRPLLNARRADIERYASQNGIPFVQDESNFDERFLRNRVRHTLIPQLEQINPSLVDTLHRTQTHMRQLIDFAMRESRQAFESLCASQSDEEIVLDRKGFQRLHPALQTGVVRYAFSALSGNAKGLDTRHFQRALAHSEGLDYGQLLEFPKGRRIFIEREQLRFFTVPEIEDAPTEIELSVPGQTQWRRWLLSATVAPLSAFESEYVSEQDRLSLWADWGKIQPPLKVRSRQPGDRIDPLGLDGHKKVHDVLIDQKVPRPKRDEIPIVLDCLGLIWVAGHCVSERVKLTANTKTVLRLQTQNLQ